MRRSTQPIGPRRGPRWRRNTAHSAGDRVSAFSAEISIATLIVTANCRNSSPGNAGNEGDRHEHRKQHQRDRDDRRGDLGHRLLGRLGGRQAGLLLHDALDILDHDDRVIDQDADRQHHREQRDRIGRIAQHQQHREAADHADRHRDGRDQRRAQAAEKDEDDDDDQHEGLGQRDQHVVDRGADEGRRVVIDAYI